jgi:glycosyltransferase involved in cell wall biosynthesis
MKVLALAKYGRLGASSRVRMLQYLPWLASHGIQVNVQTLIPDELLRSRYDLGRYGLIDLLNAYGQRCWELSDRRAYDVVWIQKEALPWWPFWAEHLMLRGVPYVLDYDDAVYHSYDRHRNPWVRRLLGHRIKGLISQSALVCCGNSYLAEYARQSGARQIELLPTVVDLEHYPIPPRRQVHEPVRIVWIGSPATVDYLDFVRKPMEILAKQQPLVLRVIGGEIEPIDGVQMEFWPWSEDTEVEALRDCYIGVMPLPDEPWERGKCGYKLIQYMACGLPVVASPVGVNIEIVNNGQNGFLASTAGEWESALRELIEDSTLRRTMGAAGRAVVERAYCLQVTAPRLVEMLLGAQRGTRRGAPLLSGSAGRD